MIDVKQRFAYNFFIVTEFEIVLDDMILVLFDLIPIKKALLHFVEVPGDNKRPSRCHNSIFFLPLALIESEPPKC
jgi:hypothetical protein